MDIDQALSGIDKLLKSQELTFAFVGVAPVIAITYAVGGVLTRIWEGGRGIGKYGGHRRRTVAWLVMRCVCWFVISCPLFDPVCQADRTFVDLPTSFSAPYRWDPNSSAQLWRFSPAAHLRPALVICDTAEVLRGDVPPSVQQNPRRVSGRC